MTHMDMKAKDVQRDCINYRKWLEKVADHDDALFARYTIRFLHAVEKHRRNHPVFKRLVKPYTRLTQCSNKLRDRHAQSRFCRDTLKGLHVYPTIMKRLHIIQAMADKLLRHSPRIESPMMSIGYDDFAVLLAVQTAKDKYSYKNTGKILEALEC